jgi:hypothetical protein
MVEAIADPSVSLKMTTSGRSSKNPVVVQFEPTIFE